PFARNQLRVDLSGPFHQRYALAYTRLMQPRSGIELELGYRQINGPRENWFAGELAWLYGQELVEERYWNGKVYKSGAWEYLGDSRPLPLEEVFEISSASATLGFWHRVNRNDGPWRISLRPAVSLSLLRYYSASYALETLVDRVVRTDLATAGTYRQERRVVYVQTRTMQLEQRALLALSYTAGLSVRLRPHIFLEGRGMAQLMLNPPAGAGDYRSVRLLSVQGSVLLGYQF
ncbi:MAG: hypothetical protein JNK89_03500, partial [Saprospiraceae bacterium]|nr:hypothetical protein [Saprospiraceae bacterium]